jgi:phosphatidylserine/phosphatidylglycerophosphate/cardiolipin synthase-like enzyme
VRKLLFLLVALTACAPQIPIETGPPIEALFCEREDCVSLFVEMLGQAEDAKCALYDVSLPEVLTALESADWITDDNKGPLMHNKFCVFDERIVWTGSWNPTKTTKANNVVIVPSTALAQNYLDEFEELPGGYRRVVHPAISYNNHLVENYFCPEDDCKENVMEELAAAEQSVAFLLASFTDEDIMRLLQEKHEEMPVEGVIDKAQHDALAALPFARAGNIHHKVFIIDRKTVITGSYNPTKSGDERNDENILVIHDPQVASAFWEEYKTLLAT